MQQIKAPLWWCEVFTNLNTAVLPWRTTFRVRKCGSESINSWLLSSAVQEINDCEPMPFDPHAEPHVTPWQCAIYQRVSLVYPVRYHERHKRTCDLLQVRLTRSRLNNYPHLAWVAAVYNLGHQFDPRAAPPCPWFFFLFRFCTSAR